MTTRTFCCRALLLAGWVFSLLSLGECSISVASDGAQPLRLETDAKIVIIGNTLAERMQFDGYFETMLQSRFPDLRLRVRNLGWSADEIDLRPRSANFDDHGHRLTDHEPDVLLAMFGLNESFGGPEQLDTFRERFSRFIDETRREIGPEAELVVFSPIPHENLQRRTLPDGLATNFNIRLYSAAMRDLSRSAGVRFVDLFEPMKQAMDTASVPLTINGLHLNELGNERLALVIDEALFGSRPESTSADLSALRAAVIEKDRQFRYDYRSVNGYYIYGGRKNPYGVVNFPEEFAKLRKMIAVRDARIWAIARGEEVPSEIDDSGTGKLSTIETNVPSPEPHRTPEESLALFDIADGMEIELFASEVEFPDLMNPVAMDIDALGRLWVTTTPCYPQYLPGTPVNDKVLILEDTTGDGRADKQTVFADGLHLPIGIVVADGGAYVSQQPDLMFLKDIDGDGVADVRERILHGFDTADSHHAISAFAFGPDGALYMQEGTFHHTQVETPYGPERVKDAAVFRYEPLTEKFSIFVSYNFANPWGHCFDSWGQNFVADASGGANYFAAAFSGDVVYPQKHRGMNQFLKKQWRPTCGCLIVANDHFPDAMQGNYLLNNTIGFLGTLQYKMSDDGSGFKADPLDPLLSSRDTNFRPVDLKFAPDGSLYIIDWFNPLIGHMQHNLRDPNRDKHHGRIWRIRNKNKPLLEVPRIEDASTEELVRLLERYDDVVRDLARRALRLRPTDEVVSAIDAWLAPQSGSDVQTEHNRLEALWVMQQHDLVRPELLRRVLSSEDERARAAATRVLQVWRDRVDDSTDLLVALAGDASPRVRLEAVRAASFFERVDEGRRIVDAALAMPLDYYLNYTITETNTTLDRRGGTRDGDLATILERVAAGEIADGQVVAVTQLATKTADAAQFGKLATAILSARFSPLTQAAALRELMAAAKSRKLQPPLDVAVAERVFRRAVKNGDHELAVRLAEVSGQWNVEGMLGALRSVIMQTQTSGQIVDAALDSVVSFAIPAASDLRGELIRGNFPAELKLRFARAVAPFSAQQAATALGEAINRGVSALEGDELITAGDAILRTSDGGTLLLTQLRKSKPDVDAAKLLLRAVYAAGDSTPGLIELLSDIAGIGGPSQPMTTEAREELIHRIVSEGSADRGQWIYRRKELNCAGCHVLSGAGGIVGPDLSGVGVTSPVEYLLDSLLYPSAQIKEAYLTLNVLTVDGTILRGVKVDRDDSRLILRDENGRESTIAIDDIEQESEGKSLMPEGLHHLMTQSELIDLVAFLSALGKPGDFVVNNRPTIQRYEVLSDASHVARLASLPEGKIESELDKIPADAWQTVYALVDGSLPPAALDVSGELIVLRAAFDVIVAGPVGVKAIADTDVQVVIDGRTLVSNGQQMIQASAGRKSFYLIVEKPDQLGVLQTEVTRPSDSPTQLTIVGGI